MWSLSLVENPLTHLLVHAWSYMGLSIMRIETCALMDCLCKQEQLSRIKVKQRNGANAETKKM